MVCLHLCKAICCSMLLWLLLPTLGIVVALGCQLAVAAVRGSPLGPRHFAAAAAAAADPGDSLVTGEARLHQGGVELRLEEPLQPRSPHFRECAITSKQTQDQEAHSLQPFLCASHERTLCFSWPMQTRLLDWPQDVVGWWKGECDPSCSGCGAAASWPFPGPCLRLLGRGIILHGI